MSPWLTPPLSLRLRPPLAPPLGDVWPELVHVDYQCRKRRSVSANVSNSGRSRGPQRLLVAFTRSSTARL